MTNGSAEIDIILSYVGPSKILQCSGPQMFLPAKIRGITRIDNKYNCLEQMQGSCVNNYSVMHRSLIVIWEYGGYICRVC